MNSFTNRMNEIENLIILLREDIEGSHCGLEPVIAINDGEQFIKCYQCEDGIMYDVYDKDPRDDEDLEPTDGGCLVNSEEDLNIDFFGIVSKLEFIGKAHLPIEQGPPLYAACRYMDGSGGITVDQTFNLSLEYQNSQLEDTILSQINSIYSGSDLLEKFMAHHNYDEAVEINPFDDESLSYGKNSDGGIYFYYFNGDCDYYHFQVFKVEPTTYLDLHF